MRVQLSQINPTIGDLDGNFKLIQDAITSAVVSGKADVLLLPELSTTGYPPRDLLYDSSFWEAEAAMRARINAIVKKSPIPITVIYGGLHEVTTPMGLRRYNAAWIADGTDVRVRHKRLLPRYDVFDETRYFVADPQDEIRPVTIRMPTYHSYPELLTADVLICEEIWNPNYGSSSWMAPSSYGINPIDQLRGNGPIFVINASPFWHGKIEQTRDLLAGIWRKTQRPVFWVNQVGANDDIVTGGYSTACGSSSAFYGPEVERHLSPTFAWLETFCPDSKVVTVDLSNSKMPIRPGGDVLGVRPQMMKQNELPPVHIGLATVSTRSGNPLSELEREPHVWHGGSYETACTFRALCLFLEDYVKKCGFGDKSLIAMSGGIDSAVTGAMASMVLGAENVHFVTMPGPYSSKGSVTDSYDLAKHLGVSIEKITIVDLTSMASGLYLRNEKKTGSSVVRRSDQFNVKETKENLQARLRAIMAMMISNDERRLVISTGNKTEISVGYCTLYGDTCGGINMLGDCWKMEVYELARLINNALKINIRNKQGRGIKPSWSPAVIPETIINKPPSAELAPGQKDTDSLPPYEVLDRILGCFVERQMDVDELWKDMSARANVSQAEVMKVWALYRAAEFKRQQMPPCPKVSERGFGPGRRMPVAAKLTKVSPERK